ASLECHCLFYHRYLLPCKHIFHGHINGMTRLLDGRGRRYFQGMFEESGLEVYESRDVVEVKGFEYTEEERAAGSWRLAVNELMEVNIGGLKKEAMWSVTRRFLDC